MFLKIAAQAFKAGDFLSIFLRFLGFSGSFSYKNFSWKKKRVMKKVTNSDIGGRGSKFAFLRSRHF